MPHRTAETRLVLDTNILVSRLLAPRGSAARAADKALAAGVLLASEDTLTELADILARPKFDRYVSREERRQFLTLLGGAVRVVATRHRIQACRDPNDDMMLHVALNGEAQWLITGDQDLLTLADSFRHSHGLHILAPADDLVLP